MRKRLLYLALMVIGCAAFAWAQSHPLPYNNPCDDISTVARTTSSAAAGSRGWTKTTDGGQSVFRTYNWNTSTNFTSTVFFGPFDLQAGKAYCIKANMRKNYYGDSKYNGTVNFAYVPAGTVVAGGSSYTPAVVDPANVFGSTDVTNVYTEYPIFFSPSEDKTGVWIAVDIKYGALSLYFYMNNFSLEESNPNVPGAPTDCWVTPNVEGYKKADFGFTAPTKTAFGTDITSISSVDVLWGDILIHSEKNPTPGQAYTFSHEFAMSGSYKFDFVATYEGAQGSPASVTETIGVVPPDHTFTSDYWDGKGKRHTLYANYLPNLGGVQLALDYKEKNNYADIEGMAWKVVRQPGNVVIAEASETPDILDPTFNPESKIISYYEVTTVYPEGVTKAEKTYTSTVISLNNPVPYQVSFPDSKSINEFVSYSLSGNNNSWTATTGYANGYNTNLMLTTPSVVLEKGKYYSFEAGFSSDFAGTPVGFEIYYGGANVPDSMTHEIMPYTMETSKQTRVGHKAFFTPESTGNASFGIRSVNWDKLENYNYLRLYDINVYEVNPDLPGPVDGLKVNYVSGSAAKLTFKASPKNIAGEAQQALSKIVIYKDGVEFQTIENPTPGEECSVDLEVVQGQTNIYRVAPFNEYGEGRSESVTVALIVITSRTDSEYINNFSTALAFDGYTVVDGYNDGYNWHFQGGEARAYPGDKMDEWLITPPVLLNAEQYHKVQFNTHLPKAKDGDYQTYISLWIGNSPEPDSMKKVLIEPFNVTSGEPITLKDYFSVDTLGTYYLGFHAECEGRGQEVYMNGFHIGADMKPTVPAAPGLKIIPDPEGNLTCKVHIDLPEKCINGTDLANLRYCYLYVDDETSARFSQSISLNQYSSFDFKLSGAELSEGIHKFRAYCQNGDGAGQEVDVKAFIGINAPSHPINCWAEQTDNDGEVKITWDAPKTDADGYEINPDLVWYNVFEYVLNAQGSQYVEVPLADSIRTTSFTCQAMAPNAGQAFKRFGVRAHTKTAADRLMSAGVILNPTLLGTAYSMPYEESFTNTSNHVHISQRIGETTTAMWGMTKEDPAGGYGADNDRGMAMMEGLYYGSAAGLVTGRINVTAEHPWVYLYVFNNGNEARSDGNEIELQVLTKNGEWTPIACKTLDQWTDGQNGWQKITFNLQKYIDETVQLAIVGATLSSRTIYIDRMYFGEAPAADVSVRSIDVPAEVFPGKYNNVLANIKNNGVTDIEGVANLVRDDVIVRTSKIRLKRGESSLLSIFDSIPLPDAKNVDEFEYKIVLNVDNDLDLVDNSSATSNSLVPDWTAYPTVLNLTATSNEKQNITLDWEAPAVPEEAASVTYDMEDYEAWVSSAKIGQMLNLDLDDEPCIAINTTGWPLAEYGHYGWVVADMSDPSLTAWADAGYPDYFTAHSGNKVLMALVTHASSDYQANDLLILPRLSGEAQTLTFWGKSINDDLRNTFEVVVSYDGNQYYNFSSLEDHGWYAPGEWHEYTFEIPAGVQYVGIRHYGYAGACLFIDDITFTPAGLEQLKVEGYNVERGGEMLAKNWKHAAYVDPLDADGNYVYQVSVVYNRGISAPVEASADFTGLESLAGQPAAYGQTGEIAIANAAGMLVKVYNAAGMLTYSGEGAATMTIPAAAGVYVVTIADATYKVTVK